MSERVFVISDLHLGGGPGFQMITEAGTQRLARFVRSVTAQHQPGHPAHLVLAGDIVDFLAEEPFSSFTPEGALATRKLASIFARTVEFWDALRGHLVAGGQLSMMIGNHDLELSLPGPRRLLYQRLGPGRVEFLYDNQALPIGALLIEHGNRYDGWNLVDHDQLRQVRSALSRGQPPPPFRAPPGSEMQLRILNPLKAKYSFIDLLKPEDSAVPPFLAVIEPSTIGDLRQLFELARLGAASRQKFADAEGLLTGESVEKKSYGLGAQVRSVFSYVARELNMHDLASALTRTGLEGSETEDSNGDGLPTSNTVGESDHDVASALDFAGLWNAARGGVEERQALLRRLRRALLLRAGEDATAFRLDYESPAYLVPAREAARRGFSAIVYGHTHLVRRVNLVGDGVPRGARYLNSGTWADLMRIPDALLRHDTPEETAMDQLAAFADDLAKNRLDGWRRHQPTFARIDLKDDGQVDSADVFLYVDNGSEPGQGRAIVDGIIPW